MRHLGCALLTPGVLEQIVGAGETGIPRKPRLFALSSMALWIDFPQMMGWQSEFVYGSFGDAIPDERPLLVATAVEDQQSALLNDVRQVAGGSLFTTTMPAYEIVKVGSPYLSDLKIIALWPFQFDEDKLASA